MKRVVVNGIRGIVFAGSLVVGAAGLFAASTSQGVVSGEFPRESASLFAATTALFDDIEQRLGAQDKARGLLRIQLLGEAIPVSAIGSAYAAFTEERGPVNYLTGYRITWYPVDRMLGVVDFMGTYDGNQNLVCGFVTWDMTDPSAPKLEHLAANYVDLGLLATQRPSATEAALLNANCAFGEVAPNFKALYTER